MKSYISRAVKYLSKRVEELEILLCRSKGDIRDLRDLNKKIKKKERFWYNKYVELSKDLNKEAMEKYNLKGRYS